MKKNHFILVITLFVTTLCAFYFSNRLKKTAFIESNPIDIDSAHANQNTGDALVPPKLDTLITSTDTALDLIYNKNDVMTGVRMLKKQIELDSTNEKAYYHLGLLSIKSGQLKIALERFKKLVSLQPENSEYRKIYEELEDKISK